MNYLKQNTEAEIIIGPLLDMADGRTVLDGDGELVLGDITCGLYKGSTRSTITLSAANFTHKGDGYWGLTLAAGNVDTLGRLKVTLRDDDVMLAVSDEYFVVSANAFTQAKEGIDVSVVTKHLQQVNTYSY